MENFKEPSALDSIMKAQMLFNKIKPIWEDIMDVELPYIPEESIESIVILILRKDGYARINTIAINVLGYIRTLCSECNRCQEMLNEAIITGKCDFRTKEGL